MLTLDSSVFITALRKNEDKHEECRKLLEKVKDGEYVATVPYIVLVEVAAAIRRRTGSKKLAIRVKEDLLNIDTIHFVDLLYPEANEAANIASEIGVRGMDAIVIQTAKSYGSTLVTLDEEMADKAKTLVRKRDISELVD